MTDLSRFAEDGVRPDSPSQQYRFPIVNSPFPAWEYVTALVVASDRIWVGVQPTAAELAVVASFHEEYCSYWYGPAGTGYRATMEAKYPFDIDGGANSRILAKAADGAWCYRLASWQYGPTMVPAYDADPMGLVPLLDRIHSIGDKVSPRWTQWKSDHADVFAALTPASRTPEEG